MSISKKPQGAFLAVTLLTVIAVTTVFMVYAALLSTWTGNVVTVTGEGGQVLYSLTESSMNWQANLASFNTGTSWYAMLKVTGASAQSVTVDWYLLTGPSYTRGAKQLTTTINLVAGTNFINATSDGGSSGNFNWGSLTTGAGDYKVEVDING
jgi:hypothetical protein